MKKLFASRSFSFFAFWTLATVACADEFPEIYNSEPDKSAAPMAASEAAATLQVPAGFSVGLFAAEPDVQNPIGMTWDTQGRLWIAENYTYAERARQFDLSLQDRVIMLQDSDSDGVSDRRTVFTDQVQMLTSIEVGHGGVWLMCPPRLIFIPDANHDAKPDGPPQVMLDGFEVAKQNYHNFANGLRWGPDGWLYGRCGGSCPGKIGVPGTSDEARIALEGGIWRFHPKTRQFESLVHGTTNPWGHDWDALGECFFINTVNGHLWHMIPGAHFVRPFTLDPNPDAFELIDMHADHWHFDTKGSWTKSRDGSASAFGGGHAHQGMNIYLGDNWPDKFRGRLLTFNLHGRRANQELLKREGSGFVASAAPDILQAKDPFFRGLDLSYGPDGAMFVIDWSDTGECHEHSGVHRTSGRVFRVFHGDSPHANLPSGDLRSLSTEELAELMTHKNEWFTRQARLILADRGRSQRDTLSRAAKVLHRLLASEDPMVVGRAMATLHAMHINRSADTATAAAGDLRKLPEMVAHKHEAVRAMAVRFMTDHCPIDNVHGPVPVSDQQRAVVQATFSEALEKLKSLASEDPSGLVRLTLASTLQRMPVAMRLPLASALMTRGEDADDHNLPLLVWYGIAPCAKQHAVELAEVATRSRWPKTQRLIARKLAQEIRNSPPALNRLVVFAASSDQASRNNILAGISDGLKGWTKAKAPADWDSLVTKVQSEGDASSIKTIQELSILFGDGRTLEQVKAIVRDGNADHALRRSALETLVTSGDQHVAELSLPLLNDARLNTVALRGVARSSKDRVAEALVKNYNRFRAPRRPLVIEVLVSRANFASRLLDAVAQNKIPAADVTAFDVRQIRSLGDKELNARVAEVWGQVRDSPADKLAAIEKLQHRLSENVLQKASLAEGRKLFNSSCAKCHRLFGVGESIGPDLTGANRSNMDYLLSNIVDPSREVSKNYRMSVVELVDGTVLNGLVVSKNENTMQLQTQNELKTIALEEVELVRKTSQSPMPSGLLDALSESQVRDLIGYLRQPIQVPLP